MSTASTITPSVAARLAALEARIQSLESEIRLRDEACARQMQEVLAIREELALRERALELSDEAVGIFDVREEPFPLVYVNGGFERQTGYAKEEVLGQSARFIHGPNTDMETVEKIRESFREGREYVTDLLSYKKDGSTYWNRVTLTPLPDQNGRITHFVAVQTDISAHVRSAEEVQQALELLEQTNMQLTRHVRRMRRNLESAAKVQQAMLPERMPKQKGLRFAWSYVPSDELAGDILNVFRLDANNIGLYLLDVSGHGTAAALLAVSIARLLSPMSHGSTLVREHEHDDEDGCLEVIVPPAEVAARLNSQFPWDAETGQFFTLVYGVLNAETREFRYVAAGHPPPLLFDGEGPVATPECRSFPIGLGDGVYEEQVIQLRQGQRLFLFSDGVTDVMDPDRSLYGRERLIDALQCAREHSLEECLDGVLTQLRAWHGGKNFLDDISLLALEVSA